MLITFLNFKCNASSLVISGLIWPKKEPWIEKGSCYDQCVHTQLAGRHQLAVDIDIEQTNDRLWTKPMLASGHTMASMFLRL